MAGLTFFDLSSHHALINLLPAPVGEHWPWASARKAAERFVLQHAGERAILLGGRVARAFEVDEACRLEWIVGAMTLAVFPHPSGRNPYWRSPANAKLAARWFADQIERTRQS